MTTKKVTSPIDMMIDAACGINQSPLPRKLTDEELELCSQLGRDVLSDLRHAYPEVVKTRPTTWPLHLRNTIANKAEMMLREHLENLEAARMDDLWSGDPAEWDAADDANQDNATSGASADSTDSITPDPRGA